MKSQNIKIKILRDATTISTGYRVQSMINAVVIERGISHPDIRVNQHITEAQVQGLIDSGFQVTVTGV